MPEAGRRGAAPIIRAATPDDAHQLAELVNMAGEGLALYLWTGMAEPGEDPWEVGRRRARRDSGGFSYRNATVLDEGGRVVACLIGYPLLDRPEVIDYGSVPAMFVPLQELENLAPGTWYVNVLAAYPECRGRGYGSQLLSVAEQIAAGLGRRGLSLIVSDGNTAARRLYERFGYREVASRPIVKERWENAGRNFVLLVKRLRPG